VWRHLGEMWPDDRHMIITGVNKFGCFTQHINLINTEWKCLEIIGGEPPQTNKQTNKQTTTTTKTDPGRNMVNWHPYTEVLPIRKCLYFKKCFSSVEPPLTGTSRMWTPESCWPPTPTALCSQEYLLTVGCKLYFDVAISEDKPSLSHFNKIQSSSKYHSYFHITSNKMSPFQTTQWDVYFWNSLIIHSI